MQKRALIVGAGGQDASYLAEFLLNKNYQVFGIHRRSSSNNLTRIDHIKNQLTLYEGDITDFSFMMGTIGRCHPHEIYNLAAQSHVQSSFGSPIYTANVNYIGCLNILEILANMASIKVREFQPKFYQASTSEMFGDSVTPVWVGGKDVWEDAQWINIQNEKTTFNPQSPYAIAKVAAHQACKLYREAHGVNVSCGILFNHESPRRGDEFVTKKITNYLRNLHSMTKGGYSPIESWKVMPPKLKLGNLDAKRDWGYAGEYVEVMWLMLQQDKPDDYVISTGETHTVREFLVEAASLIGITDIFSFVEIDEALKRPADVPYLCGDSYKAKEKLDWEAKIKFQELVKIMMEH